MQYLVNVIDYRSESGTVQEAVAIDAFNEKLVTGGHWAEAGESCAEDCADADVSAINDEAGSGASGKRI